MKNILSLLAMLAMLTFACTADAAITLVDNKTGATGTPPSAATFNTSASIGDVLVCTVTSLSSGNPGTVTVTDNVNTGNYTLLNSHLDVASATWFGIYFKVANAAGTPTVSVSESSAQFGLLLLARFNGFTGTPTADATMNATGPFTGTGTAVSVSPITSNFNKELLLAGRGRSGSDTTSTVPGWTATDGATFGSDDYYAVEATSGTTNNFAVTMSGSQSWQVVLAGIYDSAGGASNSNQPLGLMGVASLQSAPLYFHDIYPADCRRWPAANESIYQAAA